MRRCSGRSPWSSPVDAAITMNRSPRIRDQGLEDVFTVAEELVDEITGFDAGAASETFGQSSEIEKPL